jgi:hypothetical protein
VIQTDDTPVPVLDPGSRRTKTGHLWVYLGDTEHPYAVFDFTPTYSGDGPRAWLGDYAGYIQADALKQYDPLFDRPPPRPTEVGCWAHTIRTQSRFGRTRGCLRRPRRGPALPAVARRDRGDRFRPQPPERDHVADLQRVLPHDDALHEQLQDLLALGHRGFIWSGPDPGAERRQVAPDLSGRPPFLAELGLLVSLGDEDQPPPRVPWWPRHAGMATGTECP